MRKNWKFNKKNLIANPFMLMIIIVNTLKQK